MIIFSGNANPALTQKIAQYSNAPLIKATVTQFKDQETCIEIHETVVGKDVYIVQSTSAPANHHLMELLLMANALKRAAAKKVIAIIPYFGYARQDNQTTASGTTPFSAQVVADLLAAAKIDEIITVDLHTVNIQACFSMPIRHIDHATIFLKDILEKSNSDAVIVSPDRGGIKRAQVIAQHFKNIKSAFIDKCRLEQNKTKTIALKGNVKDQNCIIIDDIIDTGNTVCSAALALRENGAKKISAYITHAVLSKGALTNIKNSVLDELVVTDTIDFQKKCVLPVRRCEAKGLI